MIKPVLKVIGLFYGIFGVINLFTFLYLFVYSPPLDSLPGIFAFEALGTPPLIAVISFLITYAFWNLKRWGRYLAIVFNGTGVFVFGWGFKLRPPLTGLEIIYILLFIVLPIGIILFCLHPRVKELMQN